MRIGALEVQQQSHRKTLQIILAEAEKSRSALDESNKQRAAENSLNETLQVVTEAFRTLTTAINTMQSPLPPQSQPALPPRPLGPIQIVLPPHPTIAFEGGGMNDALDMVRYLFTGGLLSFRMSISSF
jgi:hypothetical protein